MAGCLRTFFSWRYRDYETFTVRGRVVNSFKMRFQSYGWNVFDVDIRFHIAAKDFFLKQMKDKKPKKISLIGSRVTSTLSVGLVLIVIGLCAILGTTVHRATSAVGDSTTLLITIVPGEDPLRVSEIKRIFNDAPYVERYDFTDAATVLAKEAEAMDEQGRYALNLLSDNPYGDEFVIHIADGYRSTDSLAAISTRIGAMESIDAVAGNTAVMGSSNEGLHTIMLYLGILAAVLLVISIALIHSTISLAIYSRRFNIYTMKLVGATNTFIRRPFVRAGMLTGIIAGVFATCVVCGIEVYLIHSEPIIGPYISMTDVWITAAGLIVLGALITRIASWWASTRYLNKSFDQLFKK